MSARRGSWTLSDRLNGGVAGETEAARPSPRRTFVAQVWAWTRQKPLGALGGAVVALGVLAALAAPALSPYDPYELHAAAKWQGPSATYLLGTDQFGRDVLSRLLFGSRISITIGVAATMVGTAVGLVLGLVSGYRGNVTDAVIQRFVDMLLTLPTLLLALIFVIVVGESVASVVLAVGIAMVAGFARVIRGVVLSLREMDYVEAARSLGCTDTHIIRAHIFPNVMAPTLILMSAYIGHAMVVEASLSFLGVGVQPPTPTWGQMLSEASSSFRLNPMVAVAPGLALTMMVFGFNVLGDAVRDTLDPRLRKR